MSLGPGAFVGGHDGNEASGLDSVVSGGQNNLACDPWASIAGGSSNLIAFYGDAERSFIGAGNSNWIITTGSIIGAGSGNFVANDGSSIGAGGANTVQGRDSSIGAGDYNTISSIDPAPTNSDSSIGAGMSNYITGSYSSIDAGLNNTSTGSSSAIAAGSHNTAAGDASFVGAGSSNFSGSANSFIGSGQGNNITPNGSIGGSNGAAYSSIVAGNNNAITALVPNGAAYGFVGGGSSNTLSAFSGVITGGGFNVARGDYSTIPGGRGNNAIGANSFAAGTGSQALHAGTFLWSDDAANAAPLKSLGPNEFLVRASGGVGLFTSANQKSGVELFPGSGTWASLSDRSGKTNVVSLNPDAVLAKVEALPVSEWSYRTESSVRHVGPMAQDFHAAFGVGEDDRHISSIDEDGVALAAIKSLAAKNSALESRMRQIEAQDAKLQDEVNALLARH